MDLALLSIFLGVAMIVATGCFFIVAPIAYYKTRSFKRTLLWVNNITLIILLIIIAMYQYYSWNWYEQFIPEKFGSLTHIAEHTQHGFGEGCGAAYYGLSTRIVNQIQNDPDTFFDDHKAHFRRKCDSCDPKNYKGNKWLPTPYDYELHGDTSIQSRALGGLGCGTSWFGKPQGIGKAIESEGNYYLPNYESILIVIPERRLLVHSYFD